MYRLWFDIAMLGIEAQQVVMLRAMRMATGGKRAEREAQRMVSEKVVASAQAGIGLSTGASAKSVVKGYRKKVRANARRLTR